jgi:hypothetical protein
MWKEEVSKSEDENVEKRINGLDLTTKFEISMI